MHPNCKARKISSTVTVCEPQAGSSGVLASIALTYLYSPAAAGQAPAVTVTLVVSTYMQLADASLVPHIHSV
jgi:hypothetical protein